MPEWVGISPLVCRRWRGIVLAYIMYIAVPSLPARLASATRPLYLFLLNKWYFDELYDFLFVRRPSGSAVACGRSATARIIDGLGPDGIAALTRSLARRAGQLQTGYVYHYAFAMLIGVVLLITWYLYWQAR